MFCHLHYGCPRGFLQKSLPVIVYWAKQMFWDYFHGWRHRRGTLSLPFSFIYHDFRHTYNCPKTKNWLMIKRYHWVLQREWKNWVLPSRYGVLLTFLKLNITRITLWNNFSGLCIKFRNETRRQIRYLGQNITNLQNSTFDANLTPGMRKKDIL